MPKNSKTLHKEFLKKLKALDTTRIKFESAFSSSIIQEHDIKQAYAGLYLDLFTEFENVIELLFIGIIKGNVKPNNVAVRKKVNIKPISEIEIVMLGNKAKKYFTWLPYIDNTVNRSKIFFIDGKPFTFLSKNQTDKIAIYHTIRNAIAHKSPKATNDFNSLISSLTLLPHEKTPQGFLRNIPNPSTGKTQLEHISDELGGITFTLCN